MNQPAEFVVVTTTSDQLDILKKIARQLIMDRIAACVQIGGPIQSYFSWDGRVDVVEEHACTIKSTMAMWPKIRLTILELHNYSEPQIVMLPIVDGNQSYLEWIRESVSE